MTTQAERDQLAEHGRRLDDHDAVLRDISASLDGVLTRLDKWAKFALVIGVAIASGTKGGGQVIDQILATAAV